MKLYAVYVNDAFVAYFDTMYEARTFIARCQLVMFFADSYHCPIFDIVEEDA